ncbi:hypothetical protein DPEC_G00088330 [Dallia pectoralis]|uniref:Uncharacterized protein n=1 Tax=Dallia pectoralis TaxID=75939 RepID=A0ACC2H0A1_DALPE|nr:hypothetical protein DPEC_G00088330 [Dallia pectoralis]
MIADKAASEFIRRRSYARGEEPRDGNAPVFYPLDTSNTVINEVSISEGPLSGVQSPRSRQRVKPTLGSLTAGCLAADVGANGSWW